MSEKELFKHVEEQRWCIIPPNEETTEWRVYATFDDEGGYQDEIAGGETLLEALGEAVKFKSLDDGKGILEGFEGWLEAFGEAGMKLGEEEKAETAKSETAAPAIDISGFGITA